MQDTHSHKDAEDRDVIAWAAEGLALSSKAIVGLIVDLENGSVSKESAAMELLLLGLALADASDKITAYLRGAEAAIAVKH